MISSRNYQKALEYALTKLNSDSIHFESIMLLNVEDKRLNQGRVKGIITEERYGVEVNSLVSRLLEVLDDVAEDDLIDFSFELKSVEAAREIIRIRDKQIKVLLDEKRVFLQKIEELRKNNKERVESLRKQIRDLEDQLSKFDSHKIFEHLNENIPYKEDAKKLKKVSYDLKVKEKELIKQASINATLRGQIASYESILRELDYQLCPRCNNGRTDLAELLVYGIRRNPRCSLCKGNGLVIPGR